jgi:hypothetical protein
MSCIIVLINLGTEASSICQVFIEPQTHILHIPADSYAPIVFSRQDMTSNDVIMHEGDKITKTIVEFSTLQTAAQGSDTGESLQVSTQTSAATSAEAMQTSNKEEMPSVSTHVQPVQSTQKSVSPTQENEKGRCKHVEQYSRWHEKPKRGMQRRRSASDADENSDRVRKRLITIQMLEHKATQDLEAMNIKATKALTMLNIDAQQKQLVQMHQAKADATTLMFQLRHNEREQVALIKRQETDQKHAHAMVVQEAAYQQVIAMQLREHACADRRYKLHEQFISHIANPDGAAIEGVKHEPSQAETYTWDHLQPFDHQEDLRHKTGPCAIMDLNATQDVENGYVHAPGIVDTFNGDSTTPSTADTANNQRETIFRSGRNRHFACSGPNITKRGDAQGEAKLPNTYKADDKSHKTQMVIKRSTVNELIDSEDAPTETEDSVQSMDGMANDSDADVQN